MQPYRAFVFIVSFFVQGLFKERYSALRYSISSLAIGHNGYVQMVSFLITGLLIFLFAVGVFYKLKSRLIGLLFSMVAIGLIASGIFTTDPVYGYPADKPFIYREFTLHGKLHTLFSLLVFNRILRQPQYTDLHSFLFVTVTESQKIHLPISCFCTCDKLKSAVGRIDKKILENM